MVKYGPKKSAPECPVECGGGVQSLFEQCPNVGGVNFYGSSLSVPNGMDVDKVINEVTDEVIDAVVSHLHTLIIIENDSCCSQTVTNFYFWPRRRQLRTNLSFRPLKTE